MRLEYFERLGKFAEDLLKIILSRCHEEALKIMSHIDEWKYDPWSYHDAFLELFAYRMAGFLPGVNKARMLEILKTWIKAIEVLKVKKESVRAILFEVSHNEKWLDGALEHSTTGIQGELAAVYCLVDKDFEILPLTFIQCTNKGRAPGDILIIEDPQNKIECMSFLEVTTSKSALEGKIGKSENICGKVRKYFGLVSVDINRGIIRLEIKNIDGEDVEILESKI